jgi:hypothetical protein
VSGQRHWVDDAGYRVHRRDHPTAGKSFDVHGPGDAEVFLGSYPSLAAAAAAAREFKLTHQSDTDKDTP